MNAGLCLAPWGRVAPIDFAAAASQAPRCPRNRAMISPDLLEILACPDCHAPVFLDGDSIQCVGKECRRRYAVRDGIPVMLIDESEVLDAKTFEESLARRKEQKS